MATSAKITDAIPPSIAPVRPLNLVSVEVRVIEAATVDDVLGTFVDAIERNDGLKIAREGFRLQSVHIENPCRVTTEICWAALYLFFEAVGKMTKEI